MIFLRDKKRKRYVNEAGVEMKKKKIKTESGNWISATYKSDRLGPKLNFNSIRINKFRC